MSGSNGMVVWVSDLDDYVDINFDFDDEVEITELEINSSEIGTIHLLANYSISLERLQSKNITLYEWRHALHLAEMTIGFNLSLEDKENNLMNRFVKSILDIGRPYAIARYARWENLDHPSALTATQPYGILALINQLFLSENIPRSKKTDSIIRTTLKTCEKTEMTAYSLTGLLQTALHKIADESPNHPGGLHLDRTRMRRMLSLSRLYFSTVETKINSINDLQFIFKKYDNERSIAKNQTYRLTTNGRIINSWRLRHIRPLLYLYPYCIRNSLARTLKNNLTPNFDHSILINELALIHCEISKMRKTRKFRNQK